MRIPERELKANLSNLLEYVLTLRIPERELKVITLRFFNGKHVDESRKGS